MNLKPNRFTIPFLLLAFVALIAALWAGLVRIGWHLPPITSSFPFAHGPLMVSSFLGTLITLERAVALKQRWMYLAPLFAGLGGLFTILLESLPIGPVLLALASLVGTGILAEITRREPAPHTVTMLLGMLSWLTGNLLWLGGLPIFQIVLFWQAFLVLTITGERLELNRVLRPTRFQQGLFIILALLYLTGTVLSLFNAQTGTRTAGAAMVLFALWSLRNDIAWRNLRHRLPLTRYIAWCLALGFLWLGVGGALGVILGAQFAGPWYDALLHAVFVGFVISMIFGHAPIIFPAVLGVPINFLPANYLHLGLLHFSLALRVYADLAGNIPLRMWGGLLNEVAILLFLAMTIISIRQSLSGR